MKKVIYAAAAAGILTLTAATAFAADAIDTYGRAGIAIAAPSAAIVNAPSAQVRLDSEGKFTAAAPAVTAPSVLGKAGTAAGLCLDSDCKTKLSM